jgi:hypothetical protein
VGDRAEASGDAPVDQSTQPEDTLISRQAERLILYSVRMFCSSDFVFIQRMAQMPRCISWGAQQLKKGGLNFETPSPGTLQLTARLTGLGLKKRRARPSASNPRSRSQISPRSERFSLLTSLCSSPQRTHSRAFVHITVPLCCRRRLLPLLLQTLCLCQSLFILILFYTLFHDAVPVDSWGFSSPHRACLRPNLDPLQSPQYDLPP